MKFQFIVLSLSICCSASVIETLDLGLPGVYGGRQSVSIISGNYAYFVQNSPVQNDTSTIMKVDLTNFKISSSLKLLDGTSMLCGFVSGDYGYFGGGYKGYPNYFVKVNINTMTQVSSLVVGNMYGKVLAAASSGNYGYLVTLGNTPPVYLLKVNLDSLTVIDHVILANRTGLQSSSTINLYGTNLFVSLTISPGVLVQIDTTTFTVTKNITGGIDFITSSAVSGQYVYFATDHMNGGVAKFDMKSASYVSTNLAGVGSWGITIVGDYAYIVNGPAYSTISKLDLSTLQIVENSTVPMGSYYYGIVGLGNYLYLPSDNFIVQLQIPSLSTAKWVYLIEEGDNYLYAATADTTYAYYASSNLPPDVVKIDLKTFTKVKTGTLSGLGYATNLVQYGNYLYALATDSYDNSLSTIYKVDKSSLATISKLELPTYYVNTAVASGPKSVISYYGEYTTVFQEVNLSSFSLERQTTCNFSQYCYDGFCAAAAYDNYIYYTTCSDEAPYLFKFDMSNFEFTGDMVPLTAQYAIDVVISGSHAYVLGGDNALVDKVDLSTFQVGHLNLTKYADYLMAGVAVGNTLYITIDNPPSVIVVDLKSFAVTGVLSDVYGASAVTDGTYAYFGGDALDGRIYSVGSVAHPHSPASSGTKHSFAVAILLALLFALC